MKRDAVPPAKAVTVRDDQREIELLRWLIEQRRIMKSQGKDKAA